MATESPRCWVLTAEKLVAWMEGGIEKVLLIDSRPFVEYNNAHILDAININCSKLMKRRLQQDKVQIAELIQHSAKQKVELEYQTQQVVVYDQNCADTTSLPSESFLSVLLGKLEKLFCNVHLLSGGFCEFSACFPGLCEGKASMVPTCISQPCLPVSSAGPTRILPHLYLGCQRDVLNKELMQQNEIGFVLNASNTCPKPDFISDSHFLRVPVNDSFCEKILPWLDKSVDFIEKAKASNSRVLVHCLAGISRSATIAIGYIMKRMDMSLDEAYRFVKEKRPTISPNFNFLGQLLDFEKKIKAQTGHVAPVCKVKLQLEVVSDKRGLMENLQPLSTLNSHSTSLEKQPPNPRAQPTSAEEAPLLKGINGLHVSPGEKLEASSRIKRSFSLDIKSVPYCGLDNTALFSSTKEDSAEVYKVPTSIDGGSKLCQFSPVEEVSEQTPEASPDREEAVKAPEKKNTGSLQVEGKLRQQQYMSRSSVMSQRLQAPPLHRSGSMEDNRKTNFLFGLSSSQQHLAKPGIGLKDWHSDILITQATSLTGSWYFTSDSPSHFYSASALYGGGAFAAYSCGQLPTEPTCAVRRRQKPSVRGDSRRSWHEESPFEKQFKRRSCQMEFGEGLADSRSREELGKVGSQSNFSGSMEIIEVS
ncbi:dual specificity protein phosphatase 16 [Bombina bombina]|uniref:dual specificity protein phosphatase 16 n=1 Tax=Bombina bombina TaxID=8345 RepID=UPI00235A8736|nr:dual specificity protein phosphatase 16 [Bombina bombina]XP_053574884.1 dual specificity protein phosphatase 16 [Bombina bombina]XP_053574885.1 dual specificity protein phosphatase 16 [Bombina bombina]